MTTATAAGGTSPTNSVCHSHSMQRNRTVVITRALALILATCVGLLGTMTGGNNSVSTTPQQPTDGEDYLAQPRTSIG